MRWTATPSAPLPAAPGRAAAQRLPVPILLSRSSLPQCGSWPGKTETLPWCSIWAVSRSAPPMWTLRWTACRNSRGSLLRTSRQITGSLRRAAGGSCTASLPSAAGTPCSSTKSRTPSTRTRRAGSSTAGGTASLCCCCATAPRTSPTSRRWSTAPPAARWTGHPSFPSGPAARSRWRA